MFTHHRIVWAVKKMQGMILYVWSHAALGTLKVRSQSVLTGASQACVQRKLSGASCPQGVRKFGRTLGKPQCFRGYSISLAKQLWVR